MAFKEFAANELTKSRKRLSVKSSVMLQNRSKPRIRNAPVKRANQGSGVVMKFNKQKVIKFLPLVMFGYFANRFLDLSGGKRWSEYR